MPTAYYNEWERFPAEWLCNLMVAGKITNGRVDQRSIADVDPADLVGFARVHLFAGIAGWEVALDLAGWPADLPIWTGSCPCQPFSNAGKGKGTKDERHLWPEMLRLVRECRPPIVVGEQVASKLGREWLAVVRADLEALGYAVGAADLCAAGAGAPHIRQRLWWGAVRLAHPGSERRDGVNALLQREEQGREPQDCAEVAGGGAGDRLAHRKADGRLQERADGRGSAGGSAAEGGAAGSGLCSASDDRLDDSAGARHERAQRGAEGEARHQARVRLPDAGCADRFDPWADPDWLPCRDGKLRPTQPGLFPLAHGIPGRVGQLRAYGNAIVPQVAAHFLRAFLTSLPR